MVRTPWPRLRAIFREAYDHAKWCRIIGEYPVLRKNCRNKNEDLQPITQGLRQLRLQRG
jgi:hypothetical protein